MKRLAQPGRECAAFALRAAASFVLWSLWLVLALLLAAQVTVFVRREAEVPAWMREAIAGRVREAGLHARFGRAVFDSTGRIHLEHVDVASGPGGPVLFRIRSLLVRLDPWALLRGELEASSVDLSGGRLIVPALLSPTGADEPLLEDLAFSLQLDRTGLTIDSLTARRGRAEITLRGELVAAALRRPGAAPGRPLASWIRDYPRTARRLLEGCAPADGVDGLRVAVDLRRGPGRTQEVVLRATADAARLAVPRVGSLSLRETSFAAETRFSLATPAEAFPLRIQAGVTTLEAPGDRRADTLRLAAAATWQPGAPLLRPVQLELAARRIGAGDLAVLHPLLRTPLPDLAPAGCLLVGGEPWAFRLDRLNLAEGRASATAEGRVSTELLGLAGRKAGVDLADLLQLSGPASVGVGVDLGPEWRPGRVSGHFETGPLVARRVPLAATRASFVLSGTTLTVDDIMLLTPRSGARGSYAMDTRTLDYRFLLTGALEPADINGWFSGWWPRFWSAFDFSRSIPTADIDILGRWREPDQTRIFVAAANASTGLRGTRFDTVRTRIFLRPHFFDIRHFDVRQGSRGASGSFIRRVDLAKNDWTSMDFDAVSDLDLAEGARVLGREVEEIIAPFVLSAPARVVAKGRLEGPASPTGPGQTFDLTARSDGPLSYYFFPLDGIELTATVRNADVVIDPVRVDFAGGEATGRIHLRGTTGSRLLGFDARLKRAEFGRAISSLEEFSARRANVPAPQQSAFQERMARGLLDLAVSAEGRADDVFSFRGEGNAELSGADLAQIRLLGFLSQALDRTFLDFSTLKLDALRANFAVQGRKLAFSEISITGPQAGIEAQGDYALDRKTLDMKAKLFPFRESRSLLGNTLGLVLSPLSLVLEFRLTGNLEKPQWTFVYGPASLLRSLTGSGPRTETEPAPPPPTP